MKNSCGKVVFQIFAEIKMTRNETRSFGRHFQMIFFFCIFCLNMVVFSAVFTTNCDRESRFP